MLEDRGLIPDTGALRCDLIQRRRLDCEPWYEALRWPVELADLKSIQAKSLRIHVVENASNGLGDHGSSNDKYEATAEEVLSKRRPDLLDGAEVRCRRWPLHRLGARTCPHGEHGG